MNHEPSNTNHGDALRTLAQLIDDAQQNGAKAFASIHSHGIGLHSVTLRFDAEPLPAELAAWQLASQTAWTVDEIVVDRVGGERMCMQTAFFTYGGLRVRINLVHPAAVLAVAA